MSPAASTRWCPTPEQLMILEEMYRSGIRTPNAVQIQQITAHLAFYGRIEGKNVFYWFQNHKARDRQKLRKKLAKQLQQQQHQLQLQLQIKPKPISQHLNTIHHDRHHHDRHHHNYHHHRLYDHHMSFSCCSQPSSINCFDPHQGNGGESQSKVMKECYGEKSGPEDLRLVQKTITGSNSTYGRDWMMMMDMSPRASSSSSLSSSSFPCCNMMMNIPKAPLKTLQLFPVSSINSKQDSSKL